MIKAILFVAVLLLASLGLTEFIYSLKLTTLYKIDNENFAIIIFLKNETAIEQLKYAMFQFRWFGNRYSKKIIAIIDNLSNETYAECKSLAEDSEIIFVPSEFLPNVIKAVF